MIRTPHFPRTARHALLSAIALLSACRPGWDALGSTPAQAQANGVAFSDALHRRYVNVERAPFYAAARVRIGQRALAPTAIFDDTTVWTTRPDARTRVLSADGGVTPDGRYRFTPRPSVPSLDRLADSRHITQLTRLAREGEYEWRTVVDFAVGSLSPTDWGTGFRGLLGSAEGRTDADLRADLRSTMPRTTAALGRMFALDSLRAQRLVDGSTLVHVRSTLHTERLTPQFPLYAKFVRKYVERSGFTLTFRDARNIRWMEIRLRDKAIDVRYRVLNGGLVPLEGAVRPMPETLQMSIDATTRFSIFTIGVRAMGGTLGFVRTPQERGWTIRIDKAPEWQLPLFAASMLRAPLRRPFEQGGITGRISFRQGTNGQTELAREFRFAVQESPVTRFLGGLGGSAFSEFDGAAEREENRFNAELFAAMRDDLRSLRYGAGIAPALRRLTRVGP